MRLRLSYFSGAAVIVGVILVWQLAVMTGLASSEYLPSPTGVVAGIGQLVEAGTVAANVGHTLVTMFAALGIALLIGLPLGIAIGLFPTVWGWSMASIDTMRSLPATALVPVVVLIVGLDARAEIICGAAAATWPIVVNSAGAVRQVNARLYEVAGTFRLSRLETIRKIVLPAAAPYIFIGIRIAVTVSLVVVIVVEMIATPLGVGRALVAAQSALQPDQVWAWAVIICVLGALLNGLVVLLYRPFGEVR